MANRKNISLRTRFRIFARDGFACKYCGRKGSGESPLHIDHIVPVALGGGNEDENLVTACEDCNFGKSDIPLPQEPCESNHWDRTMRALELAQACAFARVLDNEAEVLADAEEWESACTDRQCRDGASWQL